MSRPPHAAGKNCACVELVVCKYVCMYVCMYVCRYIYIHMCLYVYIYLTSRRCLDLHTQQVKIVCMCVCVCVFILVYVCVVVCMCACVCMCVCVRRPPHDTCKSYICVCACACQYVGVLLISNTPLFFFFLYIKECCRWEKMIFPPLAVWSTARSQREKTQTAHRNADLITKRDSSVPRKETYVYCEKRPIYIMKRDPFISRTDLNWSSEWIGKSENRTVKIQVSFLICWLTRLSPLPSVITRMMRWQSICIMQRDPFVSRKETHLYHERRPIYTMGEKNHDLQLVMIEISGIWVHDEMAIDRGVLLRSWPLSRESGQFVHLFLISGWSRVANRYFLFVSWKETYLYHKKRPIYTMIIKNHVYMMRLP